MHRQIMNAFPERHARQHGLELSGAQWVSRFHGSTALADLRPPFRAKAEAFIAALRNAGASVNITATHRPVQRAYLMHWSWLIVKRDVDADTVPGMVGVAIQWAHPGPTGGHDRIASVVAARAMVDGFGIGQLGVAPALNSRHTAGCGVDMSVVWSGNLSLLNAQGRVVLIDTLPRSGLNLKLQGVGATYGVIKYNRAGRDDPHWSDNGS